MPQHNIHPAEVAYYSAISARDGWHKAADAAMQYLIKKGDPFSADDVRKLLVDEPPKPNAWGGLFMAYSRRGAIHRVGGGCSTQRRRNGGYRHLWMPACPNERKNRE